MKTATSEVLMDITVKPISLEPRKAAWRGAIPCSRWRAMFSMTTMASSTTNPVEMVSAISERLSSVYPTRYMTPNVPSSESGTATPGIRVAHPFRRNRNTTMTTRAMESIRVNCTSSTEERMVVVRSTTMPTWMAGGMDASNSGSRERTRSTVSIMLAAGWRKRMMSTAGLPL